jgi:hypothetical protein
VVSILFLIPPARTARVKVVRPYEPQDAYDGKDAYKSGTNGQESTVGGLGLFAKYVHPNLRPASFYRPLTIYSQSTERFPFWGWRWHTRSRDLPGKQEEMVHSTCESLFCPCDALQIG